MNPEFKVSLKILPFGSLSYQITGPECPMKKKEPEMPRYIEPLTTNIERGDIRYGEGEYSVPKITAGM